MLLSLIKYNFWLSYWHLRMVVYMYLFIISSVTKKTLNEPLAILTTIYKSHPVWMTVTVLQADFMELLPLLYHHTMWWCRHVSQQPWEPVSVSQQTIYLWKPRERPRVLEIADCLGCHVVNFAVTLGFVLVYLSYRSCLHCLSTTMHSYILIGNNIKHCSSEHRAPTIAVQGVIAKRTHPERNAGSEILEWHQTFSDKLKIAEINCFLIEIANVIILSSLLGDCGFIIFNVVCCCVPNRIPSSALLYCHRCNDVLRHYFSFFLTRYWLWWQFWEQYSLSNIAKRVTKL